MESLKCLYCGRFSSSAIELLSHMRCHVGKSSAARKVRQILAKAKKAAAEEINQEEMKPAAGKLEEMEHAGKLEQRKHAGKLEQRKHAGKEEQKKLAGKKKEIESAAMREEAKLPGSKNGRNLLGSKNGRNRRKYGGNLPGTSNA